MTNVFIGASLIVFAVFVFYVFDIRHKKGMAPLVSSVWTVIMKAFAAAMLGFYAYLLLTMQTVQWTDLVALALTAIGATLVAAAKITLGRYHTWVGYHLPQTTIVCHGIYSRLRHPLYTGTILFEIGSFFVIFPRLSVYPASVSLVIAAIFAYMIGFNVFLATRESAEMKKKFGVEFDKYKAKVRAFIPFNKSAETVGS